MYIYTFYDTFICDKDFHLISFYHSKIEVQHHNVYFTFSITIILFFNSNKIEINSNVLLYVF